MLRQKTNWFEVDKKGLAKVLKRRDVQFVLTELIQNAWDQNVSEVQVTLEPVVTSRCYRLVVQDDDPDGFQDLSHAFTLFAESNKKQDARKRGRFNLGEKLVLACCEEAEILSTTGGVSFTKEGRKSVRKRTAAGSIFTALIKITKDEYQGICDGVDRLIPPAHIRTYFNGNLLSAHIPLRTFTTTLPTEVSDSEGYLRSTRRKTTVNIYAVNDGETAWLYEMGIPVVETGDTYHVDIQQKIPLNMDRDNVRPSYLAAVRTEVLNHSYTLLDVESANLPWVKEATSNKLCDPKAVTYVMDQRFGKKRVIADPSDPEANHTAVANGYAVITGSQLSKEEWANVKKAGTTSTAGQVFPTPRPHSDPDGISPIEEKDLTPKQKLVMEFTKRMAKEIMGIDIQVEFYKIFNGFRAWYGDNTISYNLTTLGKNFFETFPDNMQELLSLIIHEFGHQYCGNHLSEEYHRALCNLGAKMTLLACRNPNLFQPPGADTQVNPE